MFLNSKLFSCHVLSRVLKSSPDFTGQFVRSWISQLLSSLLLAAEGILLTRSAQHVGQPSERRLAVSY